MRNPDKVWLEGHALREQVLDAVLANDGHLNVAALDEYLLHEGYDYGGDALRAAVWALAAAHFIKITPDSLLRSVKVVQ